MNNSIAIEGTYGFKALVDLHNRSVRTAINRRDFSYESPDYADFKKKIRDAAGFPIDVDYVDNPNYNRLVAYENALNGSRSDPWHSPSAHEKIVVLRTAGNALSRSQMRRAKRVLADCPSRVVFNFDEQGNPIVR